MSSPIYQLQNQQRILTLETPRVMGVVNCTPDSFFAGSRAQSQRQAVSHASSMLEAGADLLDIGGQSSRPGAEEVGPEGEWQRIEGAIKGILDAHPEALLSIDTFHHEVAGKALEAGAFMVNDIYAGTRDPQMIKTVAAAQASYAFMHMQGTPATMQHAPHYEDITSEILTWLQVQLTNIRTAGVHSVVADVGFGFGKTLAHNYQLLRELDEFAALNAPILVGVSRKSMIYKHLMCSPEEALNGTTALHAWALDRGAHILRVHDVSEAVETISLHRALRG